MNKSKKKPLRHTPLKGNEVTLLRIFFTMDRIGIIAWLVSPEASNSETLFSVLHNFICGLKFSNLKEACE